MKLLKRFFVLSISAFLVLFGTYTTVSAITFQIDVEWDVGTDHDSDGDSITDPINKFEANIGSWIKQSTTNPGTFTEYGVFNIDTLYPTGGSFEGFTGQTGSEYSVTGILPEISGVVTSYSYNANIDQYFLTYSINSNNDPNGDLQLYLQDGFIESDPGEDMTDYYDADGSFGGFSGVLDKYNDGSFFAGLNIGANVGLIQFDADIFDLNNVGVNAPNIVGGNFNADFSFVPGNEDWLWDGTSFDDWEALGYAFFAELTATLAPNTGFSTVRGFDADGNRDILGDLQDGTTFSTVPEPTTMLLFGIGLLGIAGVSRKKTKI